MLLLVALLGVFAGALTTVAGMGGGFVLVIALPLFLSPVEALTVSSAALLVGNAHRAWMYRLDIDWSEVRSVALGAVPLAVVGGLAATALPEWILRGAMAAMAGLAVARVVFRLSWSPSRRWNPAVGGSPASSRRRPAAAGP